MSTAHANEPRARTGAFRVFLAGVSRARSAPAILAAAWLVTIAVSLPATLRLAASIQNDLGHSLEADAAADGVNWSWWQEFTFRHPDAARSFSPAIIGFAAVVRNIGDFVDRGPGALHATAAGTAYLLLWTFLLGGVLDRYARARRTHAAGFFAASGVFFFRFLRLGVIALIVWTLAFVFVQPFLFGRVYPALVRDVTVERVAFLWRLLCYAVFLAPLALVTLLFDYARVRAVVEDRRSMLAALAASGRFIRRHPSAVIGVFAINLLLYASVLAFYAIAAPSAVGGSTGAVLLRLLVGQVYILGRLFAKLTMYASEVALFQDRLAHAAYTARPQAAWPDAPIVEAIGEGPRTAG
jgi:hypothetical protein